MSERLTEAVGDIVQTRPITADWTVAVVDTDRYELAVDWRAEQTFPAASLAKLAIAHAVNLNQTAWLAPIPRHLILEPQFKTPGTGLLQYFPNGYDIAWGQAMRLMLAESDTTAAKMIVDGLGGAAVVNELLADSPLGTRTTRLIPTEEGKFYFGNTTAAEAAELLRVLTVDPTTEAALAQSHMWYGLRREIDGERSLPHLRKLRLAKMLRGRGPQSFYDDLLAERRSPSPFPSKEGSLEGYRHDVAKIGSYVVAALSSGYPEQPYGPAHPAHQIHARIGKLVLYSQS